MTVRVRIAVSGVKRRDENASEACGVGFLAGRRGGNADASLCRKRLDEFTSCARHIEYDDPARRERRKQLVVLRRRKVWPNEIELRLLSIERSMADQKNEQDVICV